MQATWLHPPCDALQSLMSASVSEEEGVMITIPKTATEITQVCMSHAEQCYVGSLFDRYEHGE